MQPILIYFLESAIVLSVLYLVYFTLLKKETTFLLNRCYLLATYCLAFIIPTLSFKIFPIKAQTHAPPVTNIGFDRGELNPVFENTEVSVTSSFQMIDLLFPIYFIGCAIFFLIFLYRILSIFKLIKSHSKIKKGNYTLVNVPRQMAFASFFHYIFTPQEEPIDEFIMKHELIHVKHLHSLDNLIASLVKIILWFNPFVYAMQKAIKLNHEYTCDLGVIKEKNTYQYARFLADYVLQKNTTPLTNNFAHQLKKRIIMLNLLNEQSTNWFKYLSIIPALFFVLSLFSFDKYNVPDYNNFESNSFTTKDSFPDGYNNYKFTYDTTLSFNSETFEETVKIIKYLNNECYSLLIGSEKFFPGEARGIYLDVAKSQFNQPIQISGKPICINVENATFQIKLTNQGKASKIYPMRNGDKLPNEFIKNIKDESQIMIYDIKINDEFNLRQIKIQLPKGDALVQLDTQIIFDVEAKKQTMRIVEQKLGKDSKIIISEYNACYAFQWGEIESTLPYKGPAMVKHKIINNSLSKAIEFTSQDMCEPIKELSFTLTAIPKEHDAVQFFIRQNNFADFEKHKSASELIKVGTVLYFDEILINNEKQKSFVLKIVE